jgi:hypothetical protein
VSPVRVAARVVVLASLMLGLGVTGNQVLNDGELSWNWLNVSWPVAVLGALYAEVFAADTRAGNGVTAGTRRLRGRRRVYLRQLRASVAAMETVGIATQGEFALGLRQVYVEVSLAPQPLQDTAKEPYLGQAGIAVGERRVLSSFLEDRDADGTGTGRVFAIIGGPGSGKTTLMRETALGLCRWPLRWHRWRLRRRSIPVLLYLRDHTQTIMAGDPLPEVAAGAGWVAGRIPPQWLEQQLARGRCLVMLDGLDEVADEAHRVKVVAWVRRQIERFPGNDFLLTSRPHGYLSNPLPSADVLQVRRFTGEQISRFLHNWYYTIECRALDRTGRYVQEVAGRKADDLIKRLRARPSLYDLASNPLLLTMIANVHRYRDALPGSRAALYGEMCQVLVHRRQEAKGLVDQTGLRGPQKEHVMRGLALTMMRNKRRDISIADACAAVADDLRGASPQACPEIFLEEVRKSGLLVEREQGSYAFAHLTLQEYLAAEQLGERPYELIAGVDDPWWRETTLLWAAGANATPVVNACLLSGTVRALALAFDCADEARSLDPHVRTRLEEELSDGSGDLGRRHLSGTVLEEEYSVRPDELARRRRLIAAVTAARALRDVIWLDEDTQVCAHPVPRDLYALFVQAQRHEGLFVPDPPPGTTPQSETTTAGTQQSGIPPTGTRQSGTPSNGTPEGDAESGDRAAIGMWKCDVEPFVTWLNGLFDDGIAYRLPVLDELRDPAIGLVTDLTRHTVWTNGDSGPFLYRPPDVAWPYTPTSITSVNFFAKDCVITSSYLLLAIDPPVRSEVAEYCNALAAAAGHVDQEADAALRNLLAAAELRILVHANAVLYALRSVRAGDSPEDVVRSRQYALDFARAVGIIHAVGLDIGLDHDLDSALDLARTLDLNRERERAPDPGRAPYVDRVRAPALARVLGTVLELLPPRLPGLERVLIEARSRVASAEYALPDVGEIPVPMESRERAARAQALAEMAFSHAVEQVALPPGAYSHGVSKHFDQLKAGYVNMTFNHFLTLSVVDDSAGSGRLAGIAIDTPARLALDHVFGRGALTRDLFERRWATVLAFDRLRRLAPERESSRFPMAGRSPRPPSNPESTFHTFLAGLTSRGSQDVSENLAQSLRRAGDEFLLLRNDQALPAANPAPNPSWADHVQDLVSHARALVEPILNRTAPLLGEELSCARIELLAAVALLRDHDQPEIAEMFAEVVSGLTALQEREMGHLTPNEVILLIRT